jgi:cell division septum initiation protein DivIVA
VSYGPAWDDIAEGSGKDFRFLLERLEEVLGNAGHLPFSSKLVVDEQDCLNVLEQLKVALPLELRRAQRLLSEREHLVEEANAEAERIVRRAEDQAAQLVEQHDLVEAARERARSTLQRAEEEADEIRQQADEYAYRVLAQLRRRVRQVDEVVQQALDDLRGSG